MRAAARSSWLDMEKSHLKKSEELPMTLVLIRDRLAPGLELSLSITISVFHKCLRASMTCSGRNFPLSRTIPTTPSKSSNTSSPADPLHVFQRRPHHPSRLWHLRLRPTQPLTPQTPRRRRRPTIYPLCPTETAQTGSEYTSTRPFARD